MTNKFKLGGIVYPGLLGIDDDTKEKIESKIGELTGATYEPIAYIGQSITHGINYYVLYEITPIYPGATGHTSIICVNIVNDNATIVGIKPDDYLNYAFNW